MARLPLYKKKQTVAACVTIYTETVKRITEILIEIFYVVAQLCVKIPRPINYLFDDSVDDRVRARFLNIKSIIQISDQVCIDNIRMDRNCFDNLCGMLRDIGGLRGNKNMDMGEMVALFLYILAHNKKNRTMQVFFRRSGETVSRHFTSVLNATLKCYNHLLKKAEPVTADCSEQKWSCFKNCLGALDGTHVKVRVRENDKVRYRNRKGEISTNVLGVCSRDLQFIYILPGWEGSAHDNRVLRDALSRRNPLKVPQGCYYLCDAGYMNCEGFLTPFRGQRYHLNEWRNGRQPTTPEEFFNMKHSRARNVIERCFGMLKLRWGILRDTTWYTMKTKCRIISACALLHNFIRSNMSIDPIEHRVGENGENEGGQNADFVQHLEQNIEDEVSPKLNGQSTDKSSRGSKRPKTDSLEIVKELTFGLQKISNVMENGNENIAKLTSCFQHESDGAKKRMLVNSELMKVPGLKPEEIIKAGRKIALDPLETDYFFSLPEDFRSTYVHALLLPDSSSNNHDSSSNNHFDLNIG